jgi:hypothetical protein
VLKNQILFLHSCGLMSHGQMTGESHGCSIRWALDMIRISLDADAWTYRPNEALCVPRWQNHGLRLHANPQGNLILFTKKLQSQPTGPLVALIQRAGCGGCLPSLRKWELCCQWAQFNIAENAGHNRHWKIGTESHYILSWLPYMSTSCPGLCSVHSNLHSGKTNKTGM